MKKISLAIPIYDDFNSFVCCAVANELYNRAHIDEIVVCDNNPTSADGEATRNFCAARGYVYVMNDTVNGTAPTKDKAIRSCKLGNWVVCLDSHVVLHPGFIRYLLSAHLNPNGLYYGPILLDDFKTLNSHLDTKWGSGMRGMWASDARTTQQSSFNIPNGAGGMFIVHRDHWLGFNPQMRGFGGEEGYLAEKYLQANRPVQCIPGCIWWHRFGRPRGVSYPLSHQDKFRNYYLGFKELGRADLQMELMEHFIIMGYLTEQQVAQFLRNGYEFKTNECSSCMNRVSGLTLEDAYTIASLGESDIREHLETLTSLATGLEHVLDCGSRASSSIALAKGKANVVHVGELTDRDIDKINTLNPDGLFIDGRKIAVDTMPMFGLVFIDTDPHTYDNVSKQLKLYTPLAERYIVLHDTTMFPEVMRAVVDFIRANRQFTVIRKVENNNGLVVLSCSELDKKAIPSVGRRVWTFAKALTKHISSFGEKVDEEVYQARLAQCDVCPFRNDDKCGQCGCPVDKKAAWKTEACPVGKWDAVTESRVSLPDVQPPANVG